MNLLTLISDYGENNYSLAVIKAHLLGIKDTNVLDVFHGNSMTDIESTAYQLYNALVHFPDHTIHLVLNKFKLVNNELLIISVRNQTVICPNNGIFYLIQQIEREAIVRKVVLDATVDMYDMIQITQVYKNLVNDIISSPSIEKIGSEILNIIPAMPFDTGLICDEDRIVFRIIHIDENSHAITNLNKNIFDKYCQGKSIRFEFATSVIQSISINYTNVDYYNKIGALFNNTGFMEIFMLGDKLCKLYNVTKKSNNTYHILIK